MNYSGITLAVSSSASGHVFSDIDSQPHVWLIVSRNCSPVKSGVRCALLVASPSFWVYRTGPVGPATHIFSWLASMAVVLRPRFCWPVPMLALLHFAVRVLNSCAQALARFAVVSFSQLRDPHPFDFWFTQLYIHYSHFRLAT
jgi:hypothetical protein